MRERRQAPSSCHRLLERLVRSPITYLQAPSVAPLPTGRLASRSETYLIRSLLLPMKVALSCRTVRSSMPSRWLDLAPDALLDAVDGGIVGVEFIVPPV